MKNNINMFLKGMAGRFSATVVLFALGCFAAFAGNNKVWIEDFTTAPGQTKTLEILLNNEDPISSLEFIVTLPEGLTYKENSLAKVTSRVTRSSHSVGASKRSDNEIKVVMLSTSSSNANSPVKGNSGAILTIDVEAANDYKGGKMVIADVIGSDATNKEDANNDDGFIYVPRRIDMENVEVVAGVHVGDAYADNVELTVRPNMLTEVGISLDNVISLVGMEAVVTLPEGLSFTEGVDGEWVTYSDRLSGNTSVVIEPLDAQAGTYKLIVSSLTSDVFVGETGNLFALNVVANEGFAQGDVVISNIKVSSVNGISYDLDNTLTTTVKCVTDPTGDGIWDVNDVYAIIKSSNISELDTICDLNGDGVVDINDIYQALKESNK